MMLRCVIARVNQQLACTGKLLCSMLLIKGEAACTDPSVKPCV